MTAIECTGDPQAAHGKVKDALTGAHSPDVCGIKEEENVKPIATAMQTGFPHWHHYGFCFRDFGRDPGWKFAIHMFPKRCGDGRCQTAE